MPADMYTKFREVGGTDGWTTRPSPPFTHLPSPTEKLSTDDVRKSKQSTT